MGFLLLLILCLMVLWDQFKYARRVKIFEKYSKTYLITMRIIAVLFVLWGVFFLRDAAFIFITILIAIIVIVHPYTTGLSKTGIIYRPRTGGFAGFSPKTQDYAHIYKVSTEEKKDRLKVVLNFKNKFRVEMNFSKEDKDEIYELLHGFN